MRTCLAAFTLLACMGAAAQECNTIKGDADRLLCYDARFPRTADPTSAAPSQPTGAQVAPTPQSAASTPTVETPTVETASKLPRFLKNFKLANEATPSGALRTDPANFSYAKLNNEEYSTVQAALVWEPAESWFPAGSYLADYGWGPIASYSLNRNSLTTKRADVSQGAVGLYGTLFRIKGEKISGQLIAPIALGMVTKLEAAYRRNKVDDTKSTIYTLENWLVSSHLYGGIPYSDAFAWFVTPRLGYQVDDRQRAKAGSPTGETKAVFGQLRAELFPGAIFDRMKLTLLAQRYVDVSASGGIAERAETFSKIGVEFLLYPPRAQGLAIQPSLALERSYGADLLSGLPKQGLTQLSFKLKLN